MQPDSSTPTREPPTSWGEIQDLFDVTCEHATRWRAGRWALSRLRELLGDDWLTLAIERSGDGYPLALDLLGSHTLALVEALELALRLDLCEKVDGRAKALRDVRRDPSLGRLLHSRTQFLVAGLACRMGWPVALETIRAERSPSDVEITTPAGVLDVEVRVLTQSDYARRSHTAVQQTSDWLLMLGALQGVWISGDLERHPTESERMEIERLVKDNAAVARHGSTVELSMPGIELGLSARSAVNESLRGPTVKEDLFGRMIKTITEKAEKMRRSGARWLHLTAFTGLWAFTPWARSPLEEQLAIMVTALSEGLGENKPDGIVLCSAAGLNQGNLGDESVSTDSAIALRRVINPLRARGTLIMSFNARGQAALSSWQALADVEPDWLDWALDQRGLPSIAELFIRDAR